MSNSSLVSYTKLSPNNSGLRTHAIDRISPHCMVVQWSVENCGAWFSQTSAEASSNYGIGSDGRIAMYVPENKRSWCTSSKANDDRAVTIECASDQAHPYRMNDVVYESLVDLCTDICKRNGKTKLIWWPDMNKTLNYAPKQNEMLITVHRWFAAKACPGDWLYSRLGDLANRVTKNLGGSSTSTDATPVSSNPTFKKRSTVRLNTNGADVLYLQKCLNKLGFALSEDGIFGMRTYAALRNYQIAHGLDIDGICGPQSWGSINANVSKALAKEVIHGKWGNQPNRQRLLEAEGFEYDPVRIEVDKLMGK